eukprot:jgi/Psemu1/282142/fgenesh1_pg.3_\
MDVLSGRGAAVNNHPGNKKFRALCFVRKAHFDLGNHAAKRRLATEIVEILQSGADHPPSRFLKRRPAAEPAIKTEGGGPEGGGDAAVAVDAAATDPAVAQAEASNTAADSNANGSTTVTPEGAANPAAAAAATASTASIAAATSAPQPVTYYAMTKEQAILKAQQVMRDYKRPDRLEWKLLQHQHQQIAAASSSSSSSQPSTEAAAAAAALSVTSASTAGIAAGVAVPLLKPPRARAVPSTPLEGVVDFLTAPDPETDDLFRPKPPCT